MNEKKEIIDDEENCKCLSCKAIILINELVDKEFQEGSENHKIAYEFFEQNKKEVTDYNNEGRDTFKYLLKKSLNAYTKTLMFDKIIEAEKNKKPIDTKINLCDNCLYTIPKCKPSGIEFGDGVGGDNVIKCDKFETKW